MWPAWNSILRFSLNLTEDHLDYHKTMENYAAAKARLFSLVSSDEHTKPLKSGIINADDPYAHVMKEAVHGKTFCLSLPMRLTMMPI